MACVNLTELVANRVGENWQAGWLRGLMMCMLCVLWPLKVARRAHHIRFEKIEKTACLASATTVQCARKRPTKPTPSTYFSTLATSTQNPYRLQLVRQLFPCSTHIKQNSGSSDRSWLCGCNWIGWDCVEYNSNNTQDSFIRTSLCHHWSLELLLLTVLWFLSAVSLLKIHRSDVVE